MEGRDGVVGGKWMIVDGNWEVIADRPSLWDRSSRLDWEWAKDACGHLGMIERVSRGVHFGLFSFICFIGFIVFLVYVTIYLMYFCLHCFISLLYLCPSSSSLQIFSFQNTHHPRSGRTTLASSKVSHASISPYWHSLHVLLSFFLLIFIVLFITHSHFTTGSHPSIIYSSPYLHFLPFHPPPFPHFLTPFKILF